MPGGHESVLVVPAVPDRQRTKPGRGIRYNIKFLDMKYLYTYSFWRFPNVHLYKSKVVIVQNQFAAQTFKIEFWVQNYHLILCSRGVNSLRLFCSRKLVFKLVYNFFLFMYIQIIYVLQKNNTSEIVLKIRLTVK